MHHKTYDRLVGEIAAADAVTINYLEGWLKALERSPQDRRKPV
jgi:hypothetical protein